MNEQIKKHVISLLEELVNLIHWEAQAPYDYISLRDIIFQIELKQELEALGAMFRNPEQTFEEQFKKRCEWRATTPEQCISFDKVPESITNQLYWVIARRVFEPKTMKEVLRIVLGSEEMAHLRISFSDHLPKEALSVKATERYKFLEPVLEKVGYLDDLTKIPTMEALTHYVLFQGMIFDVADIANYPLHFHARLQHQLNTKYPAFAKKLYSHNESLHALACDILLLNNKGIIPRTVLEQLIQGLELGGTRMTGNKYAGKSSIEAFMRFFTYFNALSLEMQKQLRALEGDNKNLGSIIDNELETGQCVETTAGYLKQIIERNSDHPVLNSPPEMTPEELLKLERKYKYNQGKTILDSKKEGLFSFELPTELTKEAIKGIAPVTLEDLIDLLLSFPPAFYNTLWEHVTLIDAKKDLEELASCIQDNFFNQEQKQALVRAMIIHYQRFVQEESFLFWAVKTNDPGIMHEALESVPKDKRWGAVLETDGCCWTIVRHAVNNPELLKVILELLFKKHRLAAVVRVADDYLWKVIHVVANNPESLKVILELLPERHRLLAIQVIGNHGRTVLHRAARNPEALKIILEFLPLGQRLALLQVADKDGGTALRMAEKYPECFKITLPLLPDNQRLPAIQLAAAKDGNTVLHQTADDPDSLKVLLALIPENQRLTAVQDADNRGVTVQYRAAAYNPESIKVILGLLPEDQRLNWLRTMLPSRPQATILRYIVINNVVILPSEKEFKGSFVIDFIKILIFLERQAKEQSFNPYLFSSSKDAAPLIAAINECNTFDEIKNHLFHHVNDHFNTHLSKGLLKKFGLTNSTELAALWGIGACATRPH